MDNLLREATIVSAFSILCAFNTLGMLTSVLQKLITFRFKDNVTLAVGHLCFEFSIGVAGVVFMVVY